MSLKKTSLYKKHIEANAKIVPFAGYEMPVTYIGLNQEHLAVRNSAGMFDVSHMGEFILEGDKALDLIQSITSNDASVLVSGKAQYSCLPNDKGGIVDDLIIYCLDKNKYLLVVNASNMQKDWNWISKPNSYGVKMTDISEQTSLIAVQGPTATAIVQKLTNIKLSDIPYYHFAIGEVCGVQDIIISNTGYTGAGGLELYVPNMAAEKIWDELAKLNVVPCGLGARDTLRLEMGFCLYGNDINDTTSPLEAGLGWITKFNKDFISKDIFLAQKEKGVTKKLIGFEMIERGIPRQHYPIADASGNIIGEVTSGTQSPSLNKGIGLGYVKTEFSKIDSEIFIIIREKPIKAKVVKIPFYKK